MTQLDTPSLARKIARFSTRFDPSALTAEECRQVGRALIDTAGVALAGKSEPAAQKILSYAVSRSRDGGGSTCWGTHYQLSAEDAALYNGVAGHVLDYDDVSSPMRGHPSIVLLPALVALAQSRDLQGIRLASAYAVGFEVMIRLGRAMVHEHYAKGWHATTTLGAIGGAVACSHLIGLSEEQTVSAIGLAVAQASGTRANFGTMAKSFQTGHCSVTALRAACLAECDLDASEAALDGDQGFGRLYGNGEDLASSMEGLGRQTLELTQSGIEIKKYPMCYAAHRAIDGMLDLRQEHNIDVQSIVEIHVCANKRSMIPLIHHQPRTGLQGKFSMQYAMAAAALDGFVGLWSFTDEAVARSSAQSLMQKVSCAEAPGAEMPRWNTVDIILTSGVAVHKRITTLRGASASPLTDQALGTKWRDCVQYASPEQDCEPFFEQALAIQNHSVRELIRALPASD